MLCDMLETVSDKLHWFNVLGSLVVLQLLLVVAWASTPLDLSNLHVSASSCMCMKYAYARWAAIFNVGVSGCVNRGVSP